jgi:hypothetical protein
MENESTNFEEFRAAFEGTEDYQIEGDEEAAEETSETSQKTDPETPETEQPEAESDSEEKEKHTEEGNVQTPEFQETFTLKVNKEEKTYSREEVISLAQKGADYDRVKGQLEKQSEAMEVLTELAKDSNLEIPQLLDTLRLNMLKKQGLSDETAKERLLRMKAEKENAALKASAAQKPAEESNANRAKREVEEFRQMYPDVELTKELMQKLMPDVGKGKSLAAAYRNMENAQAQAKIAELERQIAAAKQNAENRSASPGSQKDSGGGRKRNEFDDFIDAFS